MVFNGGAGGFLFCTWFPRVWFVYISRLVLFMIVCIGWGLIDSCLASVCCLDLFVF